MRVIGILSLMLAAGCGIEDGSTWLFSVETPEPADCTVEVTENYTNGTPASAPTGGFWDYTQTVETSANQMFGQVVMVGGSPVLVVNGETYTGERVDGNWQFTYDGYSDGINREEHASGYVYEESGRQGNSVTITADLGGNSMTGTWAIASSLDLTYTESDEWDVSVGIISGQTPVGSYLLDSMGTPVTNDSNASDCDSATCTLSVTETCTTVANFTAAKLSYSDADIFAGLEEAGQQPFGN